MGKHYKLTIIKEVEPKIFPSGQKSKQVLCRCDCGKEITALLNNVKRGNTQSCGRCNYVSDTEIICSKCGKKKHKSEHYKGFRCRDCSRRKKPAEQGRKHVKTYRLKHPDRVKETYKKWYSENKDYVIKKNAERRNTPEGRGKLLEYLDRSKERRRSLARKYRKNMTVKTKLKKSLRDRFYKVIIRLKKGRKYASAISLVGCSIEHLKDHLEKQFVDGMTWGNYGFGKNKWTIDHILPLDSFNLFNIEEQKKAFHYTNLQPMWGSANFRKSNKILKVA